MANMKTDREILIEIHTACGVKRWDKYIKDDDLKYWPGVSTDDDGRVLKLNLDSWELTGRLIIFLIFRHTTPRKNLCHFNI